jgi:hypothetical protein
MNDKESKSSGKEKVVFFIDKERFTSDTPWLSPRTILVDYAKEPDPTKVTLVRKPGTEKLTDLDTPIEVKDGTHFTILDNGPTPVS